MKAKTLAALFLAGLLSFSFTACDNSSDDGGTGNNSNSLVGIWQYLDAGVSESTVNLAADGSFDAVEADLVLEECEAIPAGTVATWSNDADSIYTTMEFTVNGQTITETFGMAYVLSGTTLTVTDEDGTDVYNKISTMIDCDSYGWDGGGGIGSGTLSATVDGTSMDFNDFVMVIEDSGVLSILGNNGTGQMQFSITGTTAGTYDFGTEGNQGMYIPDYMNSPTDLFIASFILGSGSLTITSHENGTVIGTFAFEAVNATTLQTLSITNGQFNISE